MMDELHDIEHPDPRPWGLWATVGFSALYALAVVLTQTLVVFIYTAFAAFNNPDFNVRAFADSLQSDGLLLSIGSVSSAIIGIGLVLLFAGIRKNITIKEYLCVTDISWKVLLKWVCLSLLFVAVSDSVTLLMGRPVVPEWQFNVYNTAYSVPFWGLAILVAAPLSEELFFRGFLFKGIQYSILGPIGAMVITSALWAGIHMQYDLYYKIAIFMGGLMLGYARYKSDSIYPSIAMHSLMSLVATIETATLIG